jgi:hypothetical protein
MRISNYDKMIKEYMQFQECLSLDDLAEREQLLKKHKYSIIFEAAFDEMDNLQDWIKQNLSQELSYIFYSKTTYNYGFYEIFFDDISWKTKLEEMISKLYTKFPNGKIYRTEGMDKWINLNGEID